MLKAIGRQWILFSNGLHAGKSSGLSEDSGQGIVNMLQFAQMDFSILSCLIEIKPYIQLECNYIKLTWSGNDVCYYTI